MCSYEALKASSGKKLPPDSKEWEVALHLDAAPAPADEKLAAVKPASAAEPVSAIKPASAAEPATNIKPASATAPASTETHP